jgi:hypothetical protein
MRYYAQYNEKNKLIAIGTGLGGIEITEEEYSILLTEICTKAELVDKVYNSEITIEEVPVEWQEEIQCKVNERIEYEETLDQQPISSDEFYDMLKEVL